MTPDIISNILVFQTNISTDADFQKLNGILDQHQFIQQWNVDHHDIDKVLRIVGDDVNPNEIIHMLEKHGIFCQELPD